MTVLPYRYQLQQLQTTNELDTYLSVCMDLCKASSAICLLADPETLKFQLQTVINLKPPTGKFPDKLVWESMNLNYLLAEDGEGLRELEKWLAVPIHNVLCLPVADKEKTLAMVQLINIKNKGGIETAQKMAFLLSKHLVSNTYLTESNRWSSRLQQLLEFIASISSSLDPDQILRLITGTGVPAAGF